MGECRLLWIPCSTRVQQNHDRTPREVPDVLPQRPARHVLDGSWLAPEERPPPAERRFDRVSIREAVAPVLMASTKLESGRRQRAYLPRVREHPPREGRVNMTLYRLKIAESDFTEIQNLVLADMPNEAGAFALAGMATHKRSTDILVRRVISIPKEHVSLQHEYHLEVSSQAVNGLIALCEANRLGAVICHSHPEDIPYSLSDDKGERRIVEVLRQFIPPQAPTASLLFFPGGIRGRAGNRPPPECASVLGRRGPARSARPY